MAHREGGRWRAWLHARSARLLGRIVIATASLATLTVVIVPVIVRVSVRLLLDGVDACIWLASAVSANTGPWSVTSTLVRAAGAALASHQVTLLLAAVTLTASAFYGLQRIFRSNTAG